MVLIQKFKSRIFVLLTVICKKGVFLREILPPSHALIWCTIPDERMKTITPNSLQHALKGVVFRNATAV